MDYWIKVKVSGILKVLKKKFLNKKNINQLLANRWHISKQFRAKLGGPSTIRDLNARSGNMIIMQAFVSDGS